MEWQRKLFKSFLLSDENIEHLRSLDSLFNDNSKYLFLAWGVLDDLKYIYQTLKLESYKQFNDLDKSKLEIKKLNKCGNIFIHKHFSDSISNDTLNAMKTEINKILVD